MTRAKPLYGSPCNRCGLCCMRSQCPLSSLWFGPVAGPCPALRPDGLGGYICAIVCAPNVDPAVREAAVVAVGAGFGCDSVESGADEVQARGDRPRLYASVIASNLSLSAPAMAVITRWRAGEAYGRVPLP